MARGTGIENIAWSDCRDQKISRLFFFFYSHGKLHTVVTKWSVQCRMLYGLYINIDITNQSAIELQTKQKFYKMVCPVQL